MIDLRLVRENPDVVRASQRARGADESLVDALLAADVARREAVKRADDLRGEQKAASQAVKSASNEASCSPTPSSSLQKSSSPKPNRPARSRHFRPPTARYRT